MIRYPGTAAAPQERCWCDVLSAIQANIHLAEEMLSTFGAWKRCSGAGWLVGPGEVLGCIPGQFCLSDELTESSRGNGQRFLF